MSDEILASVYIITLNEEENIQALLDNVKNFNEVILVDSGSTDNTLTLAAQYNNVFIHEQAWLGFSAQKSFALNLCKNEWVLNLDADEICTKEFVDEATNLIKENSHDALESTRLLLRFGEKVRHFGGEDRLIRFFRKSCGHYQTRRVHESISITGRVKSTSASILHFENLTLSRPKSRGQAGEGGYYFRHRNHGYLSNKLYSIFYNQRSFPWRDRWFYHRHECGILQLYEIFET